MRLSLTIIFNAILLIFFFSCDLSKSLSEKIPKLLKSDGIYRAVNPEVQRLLNETKTKFEETNKKLEEKIITVKEKIDVEDKMLRTEQSKRPSRTVTSLCATIAWKAVVSRFYDVYNGTGYKVIYGYFTTASLMDFLSFAGKSMYNLWCSKRNIFGNSFTSL